MSDATILLGFEVVTGKPVEIPIRHMVVAGQTQEAGKTTTMEALISRSKLKAIAFVTKRGEKAFENARRVDPYFRERADWQFVASVLEATMRERLKFERSWIINASKGAKTLADVQGNVRRLMENARGLSESVYLTLDAYLDIVVPRLDKVKFAPRLDIGPGINVIDLSDPAAFPTELQALVIRSCLEWVYEKCEDTITIIPEAWEFIPQGRGAPVKLAAIELMRKGAGLHNYVWPDSQDIGGIDKEVLRQCPLWLLGVQREANEIARTLSNIPAGIAKPKPGDIATLERGQFYACWGKHVIKTYVCPAWMPDWAARDFAMGKALPIEIESMRSRPVKVKTKTSARVKTGKQISVREQSPLLTGTPTKKTEDTVTEKQAQELREENRKLREELQKLKQEKKRGEIQPDEIMNCTIGNPDMERLYQAILHRLLKEPAIIELRRNVPELNVNVSRKTVQCDETSAQGMIVILLGEGFLNSKISGNAVWKEMKRRWDYGGNSARCYEQLDKLTELGFVTKEEGGYQAVPDMKVNIIKE